jgi:hypothetical protein
MELSAHALPSPILRKSHWDFVLEEMAWLANDFAQVLFSSPIRDFLSYPHGLTLFRLSRLTF